MNKLLVSGKEYINSGSYIIEFLNNIDTLYINGIVDIILDNISIDILNIYLSDNSTLNIYSYNDSLNNIDINIYEDNNTILNYNLINISDTKNKIVINNYLSGSNNISNISSRSISNKDTLSIIMNIYVDKDTLDNNVLEDIKCINNGGSTYVEPNIICSSNEVIANHNTTIGSINKEYLKYLESKGISDMDGTKLLINGFLYSKSCEYFKKRYGGEVNV